MKKKLLIGIGAVILAALVLMAVFLRKGGQEDLVVPAPVSYDEGDQVAALPAGEDVVVTQAMPKPPKKEPKEPEVKISVAYRYENMEDPLQEIADYCALMTDKEYGFVPVDQEMKQIPLPEITGDKGSLMLVHPQKETREGEQIDALFSLRLNWSGDACNVEVCQVPQELVELAEPELPDPMSIQEAVGFLYGMTPDTLGLEGNSMLEYQVLAMDGAVLVNGTPCLQLNVYGEDPVTGTNALAGRYLLSNLDRSLYEIASEGLVEELNL